MQKTGRFFLCANTGIANFLILFILSSDNEINNSKPSTLMCKSVDDVTETNNDVMISDVIDDITMNDDSIPLIMVKNEIPLSPSLLVTSVMSQNTPVTETTSQSIVTSLNTSPSEAFPFMTSYIDTSTSTTMEEAESLKHEKKVIDISDDENSEFQFTTNRTSDLDVSLDSFVAAPQLPTDADSNKMLHEARERRYQCHVCKKKFKQKCHLTSHSLIHTGEKPFACNICNKRFTQRSNLKTHQITHGGQRFSCEFCKRTFPYKAALRQHVMQVHLMSMKEQAMQMQQNTQTKI